MSNSCETVRAGDIGAVIAAALRRSQDLPRNWLRRFRTSSLSLSSRNYWTNRAYEQHSWDHQNRRGLKIIVR